MSLEDEITLTLRSFQKFNDFLAATGAMISNLLLIFVIFMTYVNKIKGKNILMTSMYSYDILSNLQEFYDHSKRKDNFKPDANKDKENKVNIGGDNNEIKNNDKPVRESKEKDQNIVMINIKDQEKDKKKDSKLESFLSKDESDSLSQSLNKSNSETKMELILKELKQNEFEFSLYQYLRSLLKDDHQSQFYNEAIDSFDRSIEVNEYIYLKQEFQLLKILLFDKHQIQVFDNISQFLNFSNLIKGKKKIKEKNIKDSLDKVFQRNNENDKKLIKLIEEMHRKLNKYIH